MAALFRALPRDVWEEQYRGWLRDVTAFVSDVAWEQMMLAFCSADPGWLCAFHFHSKEVVKSPGSLASPGEMN